MPHLVVYTVVAAWLLRVVLLVHSYFGAVCSFVASRLPILISDMFDEVEPDEQTEPATEPTAESTEELASEPSITGDNSIHRSHSLILIPCDETTALETGQHGTSTEEFTTLSTPKSAPTASDIPPSHTAIDFVDQDLRQRLEQEEKVAHEARARRLLLHVANQIELVYGDYDDNHGEMYILHVLSMAKAILYRHEEHKYLTESEILLWQDTRRAGIVYKYQTGKIMHGTPSKLRNEIYFLSAEGTEEASKLAGDDVVQTNDEETAQSPLGNLSNTRQDATQEKENGHDIFQTEIQAPGRAVDAVLYEQKNQEKSLAVEKTNGRSKKSKATTRDEACRQKETGAVAHSEETEANTTTNEDQELHKEEQRVAKKQKNELQQTSATTSELSQHPSPETIVYNGQQKQHATEETAEHTHLLLGISFTQPQKSEEEVAEHANLLIELGSSSSNTTTTTPTTTDSLGSMDNVQNEPFVPPPSPMQIDSFETLQLEQKICIEFLLEEVVDKLHALKLGEDNPHSDGASDMGIVLSGMGALHFPVFGADHMLMDHCGGSVGNYDNSTNSSSADVRYSLSVNMDDVEVDIQFGAQLDIQLDLELSTLLEIELDITMSQDEDEKTEEKEEEYAYVHDFDDDEYTSIFTTHFPEPSSSSGDSLPSFWSHDSDNSDDSIVSDLSDSFSMLRLDETQSSPFSKAFRVTKTQARQVGTWWCQCAKARADQVVVTTRDSLYKTVDTKNKKGKKPMKDIKENKYEKAAKAAACLASPSVLKFCSLMHDFFESMSTLEI